MSGGVLVPQLACELSILRIGAVTQYGIDLGAKWVIIRQSRHERVVEVHVHLAEERMEPVIQRCHRCIGGEVGTDSSNHLSSDEQVLIVYSGIHKNVRPTGATRGRIKCGSTILITINKSNNKTNY